MPDGPLVVLIDGDCALCNGAAHWFGRRDGEGRMVFAANQGEVARIADEPPGGDQGTIVVWQGSRRFVRSEAVLAMLRVLGFGWRTAAAVLACCPRSWRDRAYDALARRRRSVACRLDGKHLSLVHRAE